MLRYKSDYLFKYPGIDTNNASNYAMNTSFGFSILSDPETQKNIARKQLQSDAIKVASARIMMRTKSHSTFVDAATDDLRDAVSSRVRDVGISITGELTRDSITVPPIGAPSEGLPSFLPSPLP